MLYYIKLNLGDNVFISKVPIEDTISTSPTEDETAIVTWSSESREGLAICREKAVPLFLSYFKTLSIGPALGIEPSNCGRFVRKLIRPKAFARTEVDSPDDMQHPTTW